MFVRGSLTGLRVPGNGPTSLGLQSTMLNFPYKKYISIEVVDSATDSILFKTDRAMVTNRIESVEVDRLADMTIDFVAAEWEDEVRPFLPKTAFELQDPNSSTSFTSGLYNDTVNKAKSMAPDLGSMMPKAASNFGLGNFKF